MSVKDFAAQLKGTIEQIKSNGTTAIESDTLIAYLDEIIKSPEPVVTEPQLARYKAELELWVERDKSAQAHRLELFRSVISSGQSAVRSAFLLNGGAAIALLAFIGHLTEHHPGKVGQFSSVLVPFVVGVLAAAATSGVTYLSQWFYAGDEGGWKEKTGFILNILAILVGLSSFGFFIWGMQRAYGSFQNFV